MNIENILAAVFTIYQELNANALVTPPFKIGSKWFVLQEVPAPTTTTPA